MELASDPWQLMAAFESDLCHLSESVRDGLMIIGTVVKQQQACPYLKELFMMQMLQEEFIAVATDPGKHC